MPRPKGSFKAVPAYRHHKPSGRAVVTVAGRDHYLGTYGSRESRDAYDRLIGEWLASGRCPAPAPAATGTDCHGVKVVEIVAAFWRHAQSYYRKPDGSPSSEVKNFRDALRPLKRQYGETPAAEFGPLALRAVRDEMIGRGWARTHINRQVNRLRHVFKWAAGRELLPASIHQALLAVEGLKAGRSKAKESAPVQPVPEWHIDAILTYLSAPVKAMVELQLLTGMRPGEVIRMRTCDVDTSRDLWVYTPQSHKTQHHGHERQVTLGPKAKAIVAPMLKPDLQAFIFSPADAMEALRAARRAARKTPRSCGNRPGMNVRRRPRRQPGARYTVESYWHAIQAACDKAFPPPADLARQRVPARGRKGKKATRWESAAEWKARLGDKKWAAQRQWQDEHRFHPHQIRHTVATTLRKQHGLEAAQVILGHKTLTVTQVYAEKNVEAARRVMAEVG